MITEFKVSEKYGKHVINILVKVDSTDAEISLVGVEDEDGLFDILEGGEVIVASFTVPLNTISPMVVKDHFAQWLAKDGVSILDAAIAGEPAPVVEVVVEEPVVKKTAAKKKAAPKKKD